MRLDYRHTVFRQKYYIQPWREWGRRVLPPASKGVVLSDIDCWIRRFGGLFGLDAGGDGMVAEIKEEYPGGRKGAMTPGQKRIFSWLDDYITTGRWRGTHVLIVRYAYGPPMCEHCGAPKETADEAYQRFLDAELNWDGQDITHDLLEAILLD